MIVCRLCNREMRSWQGLAKHLRSAHSMAVYDYHRTSAEASRQLCSRIWANAKFEPAPHGYGLGGHCWRWQGRLTRRGYGQLRLAGSPTEQAHRLSWWAFKGVPHENPAPSSDVVIMHQCDRTWCVNPDHLVAGDHTTNMAERRERGRHLSCHDSQLAEADVHEIRLRAHMGETHRSIAEDYGLTKSAICHIVAGRSFGHIVTPLGEHDPEHIPF